MLKLQEFQIETARHRVKETFRRYMLQGPWATKRILWGHEHRPASYTEFQRCQRSWISAPLQVQPFCNHFVHFVTSAEYDCRQFQGTISDHPWAGWHPESSSGFPSRSCLFQMYTKSQFPVLYNSCQLWPHPVWQYHRTAWGWKKKTLYN